MSDIELAVIGALIAQDAGEDSAVQEAMLRLTPDCFYHQDAYKIFCLIKKFDDAGELFDFYRLLDAVPTQCDGFFRQAAIQSGSSASLKSHVESLLGTKMRRQTQKELKQTLAAFDKEPVDSLACSVAVDSALRVIHMSSAVNKRVKRSAELLDDFLSNKDEHEILIKSGIPTIDSRMHEGGFRNRTLITIAGRPSTGKTCFAMYLAQHLAANHPAKKILFFSLEMSMADIYKKQITSIAGRQASTLSDQEKVNFGAKALETEIIIHECVGESIDYIETNTNIEAATNDLGVVVVDYLGIVQNSNKLESQALRQADISTRLATMAKKFNCIVIALSQVNREYANREDKRPLMSDAADSSGSERNSDVWLGIYRPEFDSDNQHVKNQFIVNCRKDRFGNLWEAMFSFNNGAFSEVVYR